jgi:peptide-methionine (R)-S-oxide reductase
VNEDGEHMTKRNHTQPPARGLPTDEELRDRLSPLAYEVTQKGGTERAFTGELWDNHDDGTYRCVVCGEPLFSSETKFDSGTGWPSFYEPMDGEGIDDVVDTSHGMMRTEVRCSKCGAHLGHVFPDGPNPTGLRYCINSCSLDFRPEGAEDVDA